MISFLHFSPPFCPSFFLSLSFLIFFFLIFTQIFAFSLFLVFLSFISNFPFFCLVILTFFPFSLFPLVLFSPHSSPFSPGFLSIPHPYLFSLPCFRFSPLFLSFRIYFSLFPPLSLFILSYFL